MATNPPVSDAIKQLANNVQKQPRTLWGDAWRRFRRHKFAMVGMFIIFVFIVVVLTGPTYWRVNRDALDFVNTMSVPYFSIPEENVEYCAQQAQMKADAGIDPATETFLDPMCAVHPFGSDELGRDLFARALYGGRISLSVGFTAMLIAVTLGATIGAISGYFGGVIDEVLSFITNLFLSLPSLPLLLLTVYLFRDAVTARLGLEFGMFVIVVTMIGVLAWMSTARIVRASFISLKQKEFVEAAVCVGVSRPGIMFRHILPNALSPIIVAATLEVGSAIISESTLSFLGIGFPPDTPTWGRLVTDGSQYLQSSPHLSMIPAALIFFTVLSINFMGDGLRDALDPRSRL
jgi:peptide/nickel transport system permease protein